jgi:hypothetical protein
VAQLSHPLPIHPAYSIARRLVAALLGLLTASVATACAVIPIESSPVQPVEPRAMPATEGCPPEFLEKLNSDQIFVVTSVEEELGDDPLVNWPFLQHVCMGNAWPQETHTAFFGGDENTLQDIGEDLAAYGFKSNGVLEMGDGLVSMSWRRDDPYTLVKAETFGGSPQRSVYGYDATDVMGPSFSVITIAYLD